MLGSEWCHLEAQCVGYADAEQCRSKQLRVLRDRAADGEATRTDPLGCEELRRGVTLLDQELSAGDEVVNGVLLMLFHSRHMPGLSVLAADADMRNGMTDAALHA